jgi:hypothetical protein
MQHAQNISVISIVDLGDKFNDPLSLPLDPETAHGDRHGDAAGDYTKYHVATILLNVTLQPC